MAKTTMESEVYGWHLRTARQRLEFAGLSEVEQLAYKYLRDNYGWTHPRTLEYIIHEQAKHYGR